MTNREFKQHIADLLARKLRDEAAAERPSKKPANTASKEAPPPSNEPPATKKPPTSEASKVVFNIRRSRGRMN